MTVLDHQLLPCEPQVNKVSETNVQAHDAGYDAYMTGVAFLKLAYHYQLQTKGIILYSLSCVDIINLKTFYETPFPSGELDVIYKKTPSQFQHAMNIVNLFNMKYGLHLKKEEYEAKQQEMNEEFHKMVYLVTGFEEVENHVI